MKSLPATPYNTATPTDNKEHSCIFLPSYSGPFISIKCPKDDGSNLFRRIVTYIPIYKILHCTKTRLSYFIKVFVE